MFKLNIPGRDQFEADDAANPRIDNSTASESEAKTPAKAANLRIEDEQIRRFAGFAEPAVEKAVEPEQPIRRFAAFADPDDCNEQAKRERSAIITADGAPLWQADALAGLQPWSDAEIELFVKRQARIAWLGYGGASEFLAEKLVNRDRDRDDRRLCVECAHAGPGWRCNRNAGFMLEQLQRCNQFKEETK